MNRTEAPTHEPLHLLLVRSVVYTATLLILLAPITIAPAVAASVVAALVGLVLGRFLAPSKVRTPVVLLSSAVVAVLGGVGGWLLGSAAGVAQSVGIPNALALSAGVAFSLITLATVTSLRMLALRWKVLSLIEVATVAAAVAVLLSPARDWKVSQPRFLADWAFSHGLDPAGVLMKIGVVTLMVMALLLLPRQRWPRTVAAVSALALCWFAFWLALPLFQNKDPHKDDRDLSFVALDPNAKQKLPAKPKGPKTDGNNGGNNGGRGNGGGGNGGGTGGGNGGGNGDGGGGASDGNGGGGNGGGGDGDGGEPPPRPEPMDYGDRGDNQHPRPVALVLLHTNYKPADGSFHLRGEVFTRIENNRLVKTTLPMASTDVPSEFPTGKVFLQGPALPGKTVRETAALLKALQMTSPGPAGEEGMALTPALVDEMMQQVPTTVSFLYPDPQPVTLGSPVSMQPAINPNPKRYSKVYRVTSECLVVVKVEGQMMHPYALLAHFKAGDPSWPQAVREEYLAVPKDPRYATLAKQVLDDAVKSGELPANLASSPVGQYVAFKNWIHKNTIYSLKPGNGEAADPAAELLFGNHKGHCVYVSTAMAYLLRTQGVPTRVIGGFAPKSADRGDGSSILVQSSDGHAWCEMYLQGIGWVPVEASQERSEAAPPPPPDEELKNHLREEFGLQNEEFVKKQKRLEEGDESVLEDEKQDEHAFSVSWWLVTLLVTGPVLVTLVFLYLVKAWRRLAPHFGPAEAMYRLAYRATLDRLAEVGLVRRFGESREEFAARVKEQAPELQDLTLGHLRRALGGTDSLGRATWLELSEQVRQRLRGVFPRMRRFLGLINPVTWLWVH